MTKKNKIKLEDIHSEALKRFEASASAERNERDECLEDFRFCWVQGAQWSDVDTNARQDRPRFELNKVAVPVNQLIGEQRQNRVTMKARASKGAATKKMADNLTGLMRNICNECGFQDVTDNAFKELATGGFGAWCLSVDYADDDSFDQEIKIKTIRSAASSVFYDPSAVEELKQDAKWIMVTEDMDRSSFMKKYPDSAVGSLSAPTNAGFLSEWQTRDTVRIADYWTKEQVKTEIALMSDGRHLELNKKTKSVLDELEAAGITIEKTRQTYKNKVTHYKISAGEILEGPHEWAGSMIPVVPIFGYNIWIDGQHYYHGMVRMAKDPQRIYNYATSQAIEVSALTPKDPYWVTPSMMQGHESQMRNFNVTNNPFMFYNEDPVSPGPPKRAGAPSVQTALIQQVQQADADVQATTGLYAPSLGEATTDQSGRAILALQRQGNVSTHELTDNLVKAVQYTGKILIDLIPKIYDTERQVAILAEDGTTEDIILNQTVLDQQTRNEVILNDISMGKYDVVSASGPSFATQRSETLNILVKLAESNPEFAAVSSDLIAKNVDFDQSEELSKRIRKQMLAQGLVDPTQEEIEEAQSQPPQEPSPVEKIQFEKMKLELEQFAGIVDQIELQNDKIKADTDHKRSQTHENLTNAIETKVDINAKLDERGMADVNMPVEPAEIAARQKNLQALNNDLTMDAQDVGKTQNPQPLPQDQMPPQMV